MSQASPFASDLGAIRAEVCPQIEALADDQVLELDASDFALDAEGVYGPAYGSPDQIEQVPQVIVDQQRAIGVRLNMLLGRLGVIDDITELFDPTTQNNVSFIGGPDVMMASIETNTSHEAAMNGDAIARVSFQGIPTNLPTTELRLEDGSSTGVTETAQLDILRTAKDGDRWVEVVVGRTLVSDLAQFGVATRRRAQFFYDPRSMGTVLPYVRIHRGEQEVANLAVAGTRAWAKGLEEIHETIDLIETAVWPTERVEVP